MKIKTSELTEAALDWAVGMAEGMELTLYGVDPSIRARVPGLGLHAPWSPRRYWNQGGPIIWHNRLELFDCAFLGLHEQWKSVHTPNGLEPHFYFQVYGPTPLVAAMRCYVLSKLGEEVDVPEELT